MKAESSTPQLRQQALVPFDDQGEFEAGCTEKEPTQLGHSGMSAFLVACIAIVAIGVMSYFALSALQQPTGLKYTTDTARIDPGWMVRSTQPGWTEPLPGLESTAVRESTPETSQTATVAQTAPETVAPEPDAALRDQEQMLQSAAALPQTVEQLAAGRAQIAREEAKLQAADVEILAKIPMPRPRPIAVPAGKSISVLPLPARALMTPLSLRIPPH